MIVIFSYVAVYAAHALKGFYEPVDPIPVHLLIVMGFSIMTAAAAKGITAGYLETGRVAKTEPPSTKADPNNPKLNVEGKTLKSSAISGRARNAGTGKLTLKIKLIRVPVPRGIRRLPR